jgi:hypothetical protein
MVAAAGLEEQSLQAVSIPGTDFSHGLQGVQFCGTAVHLGEPSQQVVGGLGPNFLHRLLEMQSHCTAASLGEQSLRIPGIPGPDLSHRLQRAQFCGASSGRTEPASLHLLFPMEQWKPLDLLTQGPWFLWHFRVKVAAHLLG